MPFQDFFIFIFPGMEYYFYSLFEIFGVRFWILNLTILILFLGISVVGFYLSRNVLSGWGKFLPVALFLVGGFRDLGTDGSHRFFSVLLGSRLRRFLRSVPTDD